MIHKKIPLILPVSGYKCDIIINDDNSVLVEIDTNSHASSDIKLDPQYNLDRIIPDMTKTEDCITIAIDILSTILGEQVEQIKDVQDVIRNITIDVNGVMEYHTPKRAHNMNNGRFDKIVKCQKCGEYIPPVISETEKLYIRNCPSIGKFPITSEQKYREAILNSSTAKFDWEWMSQIAEMDEITHLKQSLKEMDDKNNILSSQVKNMSRFIKCNANLFRDICMEDGCKGPDCISCIIQKFTSNTDTEAEHKQLKDIQNSQNTDDQKLDNIRQIICKWPKFKREYYYEVYVKPYEHLYTNKEENKI